MKQINYESGVKLGPYNTVEVTDAGMVVDGGGLLPASVYGPASIMEVPSLPAGAVWGHWQYDGEAWVLTAEGEQAQAKALQAAIATLVLRIDQDADAVRKAVIGERGTEYQIALEQALDYQAADYEGTAPPYVSSWTAAKAAGGTVWTHQQSADDIIATGDAWLGAQEQIRAQRLLCKELARAATTPAALQAVVVQWKAFMDVLRQSLGVA